jgi:hypothetical protein
LVIRTCAELVADFPDDAIEDEHDFVQWGGRGVAEAVVAVLRRSGYEVTDPQHQHEHGWDFDVALRGRRAWMQVTDMGKKRYVLATSERWHLRIFNKQPEFYPNLLTNLNVAVANRSPIYSRQMEIRA